MKFLLNSRNCKFKMDFTSRTPKSGSFYTVEKFSTIFVSRQYSVASERNSIFYLSLCEFINAIDAKISKALQCIEDRVCVYARV